MRILRAVLSVLAVALALPATASFHTFAIQQLYSNADGSIQFIVLKKSQATTDNNFLPATQSRARRAVPSIP
jgi:hypothetical protein